MTQEESIYHRFVNYEWNEVSEQLRESILKAIREGYNARQSEVDQLKKEVQQWKSSVYDCQQEKAELHKINSSIYDKNKRLKAELETAKHLNNVFRERLYKNSSLNDLDDGSMKDMKIVQSKPSPPTE